MVRFPAPHRPDAIRTRLLRSGRLALLAAFALVLAGCASHDPELIEATATPSWYWTWTRQAQREHSLRSTWRGQPYQALLVAYGPPKLTLKVPGDRPFVTLVIVYELADEEANCIDAYTLVQHEQTRQWLVADYFCR